MNFLSTIQSDLILVYIKGIQLFNNCAIQQIAVRYNCRTVGNVILLADVDEFLGKAFNNIKCKERLSTIPCYCETLKMRSFRFNKFNDGLLSGFGHGRCAKY